MCLSPFILKTYWKDCCIFFRKTGLIIFIFLIFIKVLLFTSFLSLWSLDLYCQTLHSEVDPFPSKGSPCICVYHFRIKQATLHQPHPTIGLQDPNMIQTWFKHFSSERQEVKWVGKKKWSMCTVELSQTTLEPVLQTWTPNSEDEDSNTILLRNHSWDSIMLGQCSIFMMYCRDIHPPKINGWNLEMMVSNRNLRDSKGPPFSR